MKVVQENAETVDGGSDKGRGFPDWIDRLEGCMGDRDWMCPMGEAGVARDSDTAPVGGVVLLGPDSGLRSVHWSDSQVNQTDLAGDDIVRQAQY